jgi:hypothetical protein
MPTRRQLCCLRIQPQIKDYVVEATIYNLDMSNVRSGRVEEREGILPIGSHMEQRQS